MYSSNIRKYRLEKKLKLKELSIATNLSMGYLSHLEKGVRNNPSIQVMELISEALDKNILEIFFND